ASLVASGGRLYWANSSDLTIRSVAVGGGAVSTISSAGSAPGSVDVDASNVYWTEPANGAVQFAPLSGGAAVALATGQQDPRGISVVSGTVYWSNYHGGSVGTVMSAPVSGGL